MLSEHLWEVNIIAPSEGLWTKYWKYISYKNNLNHEELYDLINNPQEINNLVKTPSHKKTS